MSANGNTAIAVASSRGFCGAGCAGSEAVGELVTGAEIEHGGAGFQYRWVAWVVVRC
jgi:hypothetical protein